MWVLTHFQTSTWWIPILENDFFKLLHRSTTSQVFVKIVGSVSSRKGKLEGGTEEGTDEEAVGFPYRIVIRTDPEQVVAACASKEQADTHWEWLEEKLLANISYSLEERQDMFTWMLSKLKGWAIVEQESNQNIIFRKLVDRFGLPAGENVIGSYWCAVQHRGIPRHGWMVVFENYIGFSSKVLKGHIVLPFIEIIGIHWEEKIGVALTDKWIRIETLDGTSRAFVSVAKLKELYGLLYELWDVAMDKRLRSAEGEEEGSSSKAPRVPIAQKKSNTEFQNKFRLGTSEGIVSYRTAHLWVAPSECYEKGKFYLSQNFICFNSNSKSQTILVIPFTKLHGLEKSQRNSYLNILADGIPYFFSFSTNDERQQAYIATLQLWSSVNPHLASSTIHFENLRNSDTNNDNNSKSTLPSGTPVLSTKSHSPPNPSPSPPPSVPPPPRRRLNARSISSNFSFPPLPPLPTNASPKPSSPSSSPSRPSSPSNSSSSPSRSSPPRPSSPTSLRYSPTSFYPPTVSPRPPLSSHPSASSILQTTPPSSSSPSPSPRSHSPRSHTPRSTSPTLSFPSRSPSLSSFSLTKEKKEKGGKDRGEEERRRERGGGWRREEEGREAAGGGKMVSFQQGDILEKFHKGGGWWGGRGQLSMRITSTLEDLSFAAGEEEEKEKKKERKKKEEGEGKQKEDDDDDDEEGEEEDFAALHFQSRPSFYQTKTSPPSFSEKEKKQGDQQPQQQDQKQESEPQEQHQQQYEDFEIDVHVDIDEKDLFEPPPTPSQDFLTRLSIQNEKDFSFPFDSSAWVASSTPSSMPTNLALSQSQSDLPSLPLPSSSSSSSSFSSSPSPSPSPSSSCTCTSSNCTCTPSPPSSSPNPPSIPSSSSCTFPTASSMSTTSFPKYPPSSAAPPPSPSSSPSLFSKAGSLFGRRRRNQPSPPTTQSQPAHPQLQLGEREEGGGGRASRRDRRKKMGMGMGVLSGLNLDEGSEEGSERESGKGSGKEKWGYEFEDDKKEQEVIRVNEPKPLPETVMSNESATLVVTGVLPIMQMSPTFTNYIELQAQQTQKWVEYFASNGKSICSLKREKVIENLLFSGPIPDQFRGFFWFWSSGASFLAQTHPPEYYRELTEDTPTPFICAEIEKDLHRSFPRHPLFQKGGMGIPLLRRVLRAYSLRNPKVGYCQSLNIITSLLLCFMSEECAFWTLSAICEVINPSNYWKNLLGILIDRDVFEVLFQKKFPNLSRHLTDLNFSVSFLTQTWFMVLFIGIFPLETALEILDSFFFHGKKFLFSVALVIFQLKEFEMTAEDDVSTYPKIFSSLEPDSNFMPLVFKQLKEIPERNLEEIQKQKKFSEIRNIDQAFASEKIEKLSQITPFSVQRLTNFFDFFKKANEDPVGRLVVNRSQFSSAMLKALPHWSTRPDLYTLLFEAAAKKEKIDFEGFVTLLVVPLTGSLSDRLELCFRLHDLDSDGYIDNGDCYLMLDAFLRLYNIPFKKLSATAKCFHEMVQVTPTEASEKITFSKIVSELCVKPLLSEYVQNMGRKGVPCYEEEAVSIGEEEMEEW